MPDLDLVLPVPRLLSAFYLVPCSMPNGRVLRLTGTEVASRVAEPLRSLTCQMLQQGSLVAGVRPAATLPALQEAIATEFPWAESYAVFGMLSRPMPGPVHEWASRAAAAAFADGQGLPLMDAYTRWVIEAETALASLPGPAKTLGAEGGFHLGSWVDVIRSGSWLVTTGMGRFGLPELRVSGIPEKHRYPWGFGLTALGHRLLEALRHELRQDPEAAFVRVPAEPVISPADVGRAFGLPAMQGDGLAVRLVLDPDIGHCLGGYLTVEAPEGWRSGTQRHRLALRELLVEAGERLFSPANRA